MSSHFAVKESLFLMRFSTLRIQLNSAFGQLVRFSNRRVQVYSTLLAELKDRSMKLRFYVWLSLSQKAKKESNRGLQYA